METNPRGSENVRAFLNSFGIPLQQETVERPNRVHRMSYLAITAGIELQYEHCWNGGGPYSHALQEDLAFAVSRGTGTDDHLRLGVRYESAFLRIMTARTLRPVDAEAERWTDLLATLAFLTNEMGYQPQLAAGAVTAKNPDIAAFVPAAHKTLMDNRLLRRTA